MTATPHRLRVLTLGLALAGAPAVAWHGAFARTAALWPEAGTSGAPLIAGHEALLLLAIPLLTLSVIVLFLAPGLLLALALGRGASVPEWVLSSVPGSVVAGALVVTAPVALGSVAPSPWLVGGTWLAIIAGIGTIAAARSSRGTIPWPIPARRALLAPGLVIAFGYIATVLLGPKLFWESFNGDGAHAFEASRLLLRQPWPFFPASAGDIAGFPGPTSMVFAWPNAWFLALLGPIDAAARLPFIGYLMVLALALQALAEVAARPLGGRTVLALGLGLVPFVLAMAFSATYEPYHADLALPGVQDLLLLVCVAGFVHGMLRRQWPWALAFGLLAHLSLPNGLVLIGCWLVAEVVVMRPIPWPTLARGAGVVVACLVASAAIPLAVALTGHPAPGDEYGIGRAVSDLLRISPLEWRRPTWWLVGAGIFPVLAMGWWRRQDDTARRITVMVILYYAFFHVQARVSLHHFAPAMVLPLVVAARMRPTDARARHRYLGAWAAAAVVAVVLAAPRSFAIHTASRDVGATVNQQVGDYHAGDAAVFAAASQLSSILPPAWDASVPKRAYGGSPLAWIRYSHGGPVRAGDAYLLLLRENADVLGNGRVAVADDAFALVVLDSSVVEAQRALRPDAATAAVFRIPRATLFGPGGPGTVDLRRGLRRR